MASERRKKTPSTTTKFKLNLKGPGDFRMETNGECGEAVAFGLYMLIMGDSMDPKAAALNEARRAYLDAAAKYHHVLAEARGRDDNTQ